MLEQRVAELERRIAEAGRRAVYPAELTAHARHVPVHVGELAHVGRALLGELELELRFEADT